MRQVMPLQWSDDFKIGIELIDNEHKSLVASFNRFVSQINCYEEAASVKYGIDILESYVSYHFKHEEEFMASQGYDELDHHVSQHNELIDDLMAMKGAMLKRKLTAAQFCELFRTWLTDHIIDEDRKIAEFVCLRGAAAGTAAKGSPHHCALVVEGGTAADAGGHAGTELGGALIAL